MRKSLAVWLFCLALTLIFSVYYLTKIKFNDTVEFSGDAWQYQSLAVNFLKGSGLMKAGAIHGDYHDIYKFKAAVLPEYQLQLNYFQDTGRLGGNYQFYRTPGYVAFLASVYRIFGVHPAAVKSIQLVMVVIIASFLPFAGYLIWKKRGLIAGFLAGMFYLNEYARGLPRDAAISYPGDIMAEPLIAFSLFLFILIYLYWQKRQTFLRLFFLGIFSAICILIKGTNIFIPLFVIIFNMRKTNLFAYILGLTLLLLPWSVYASKQSGEIVMLSTQTTEALLEGNNEFAADGGWHPEGYSYAGTPAFYRRPEIASLTLPRKLTAFFAAYPQMMPKLFLAKIQRGFGGYVYLALASILLMFNLAGKFLRPIPRLLLGLGVILYIFSLYRTPELFNISLPPFRMDLVLLALFILLGLMKLKKKLKLVEVKTAIPAPLAILFLSYLLLTLITFGWPRYIQVLDFIFMLTFFKYFIDLIVDLFGESVKIMSYEK